MRREFQREIYKLETTDKKLNRDLKKAIDKKESTVINIVILGCKENNSSSHIKKPKVHC
jgi:hypothetical protein